MTSPVLLDFDEQVYSVSAIQKAAYRSLHRLNVTIDVKVGRIYCKITPNIGTSEDAFNFGLEEFKKDILDYQLREKLSQETEQIRNLILSLAFSKTGLQQN